MALGTTMAAILPAIISGAATTGAALLTRGGDDKKAPPTTEPEDNFGQDMADAARRPPNLTLLQSRRPVVYNQNRRY